MRCTIAARRSVLPVIPGIDLTVIPGFDFLVISGPHRSLIEFCHPFRLDISVIPGLTGYLIPDRHAT